MLAGCAAVVGCGGGNGASQVMIPTDPADLPENKAKASMDFYRQNMLKKKKGARKS